MSYSIKRWLIGVLGMIMMLVPLLITADEFNLEDSKLIQSIDKVPQSAKFHYDIGGALPLPVSGGLYRHKISYNTNPLSYMKTSFSCGLFDASVSVKNLVSDAKSDIYKMYELVQTAITNAIAGMPMYLLQKTSPSLYNLLNKVADKAKFEFDIGVDTCEELEEKTREGHPFPFADMVRVKKDEKVMSVFRGLKEPANYKDKDVTKLVEKAESEELKDEIDCPCKDSKAGSDLCKEGSTDKQMSLIAEVVNCVDTTHMEGVSLKVEELAEKEGSNESLAEYVTKNLVGDVVISAEQGLVETHYPAKSLNEIFLEQSGQCYKAMELAFQDDNPDFKPANYQIARAVSNCDPEAVEAALNTRNGISSADGEEPLKKVKSQPIGPLVPERVIDRLRLAADRDAMTRAWAAQQGYIRLVNILQEVLTLLAQGSMLDKVMKNPSMYREVKARMDFLEMQINNLERLMRVNSGAAQTGSLLVRQLDTEDAKSGAVPPSFGGPEFIWEGGAPKVKKPIEPQNLN